jgi:hypothetical protein
MRKNAIRTLWPALGPLLVVLSVSLPLRGTDRFQVEVQGGFFLLNPSDLNLLSRAEEQYNEIYFIQRHLGWQGYFLNDFPEIRNAAPFGLRLRCRLSDALSLSAGVEGFRRSRDYSVSGTFSYSAGYILSERKEYKPFHIGLEGWTATAGVHYRFRMGEKTELEVGVAGGWARVRFDFKSNWTYNVTLDDVDYPFASTDGGTLEGNGTGSGFSGQVMLRLSRLLGRRWGFFVESNLSYCRLTSIKGSGREMRQDIPGETTWEGAWGIKREEITMPYMSDTVLVPTNYWEGWTAGQRIRDFALDLSGLHFGLGFFVRF